jgi:hypothetical protein
VYANKHQIDIQQVLQELPLAAISGTIVGSVQVIREMASKNQLQELVDKQSLTEISMVMEMMEDDAEAERAVAHASSSFDYCLVCLSALACCCAPHKSIGQTHLHHN